jgi:alkylation response protein AidB-like acyl-CoA dehydrogenase
MTLSPKSAYYDINRPAAHVITTDAEAIEVAQHTALQLREGDIQRDQDRTVPASVVDSFSNSGLWGITVPRAYGGAEVSHATLAQVIVIISAADPSLGQIPQNHYCLLEDIRLQGTEGQRNRSSSFLIWCCKGIASPTRSPRPVARMSRTSARVFVMMATTS